MSENSSTEFKREYTADVKKAVVAFANTNGGTLYIRRDNTGAEYPIADVDGTITQTANAIRDGILPDVTMFVNYRIENTAVVVDVREGTNKPYYLTDKGLKPSGVYVRQGAESVPASYEQIRAMIKLSDGDKYESARSMSQELTFTTAADEFSRQNTPFGESQMRTLGLIGIDGLYTNLGLLLSDQCVHTIKFAVFSGTQKGEFKTRKEIGGSLFRQLHHAFDFLSLTNNLAAVFSGLDRIEQYDYPEEAVREGMLNALIHREYSFSGSIIVNIYDDRMEFVSLGGLMPGLTTEDILLGVSQPRNEKLANVFYRLKYIEAYGTGLKRIMQYYKDFPVKPEIIATHGAFLLTLPNMNYNRPVKELQPNSQHQRIASYLKEHGAVTCEDVQKLLKVGQTRAYTVLREMVADKIIIKKSKARDEREYVLVSECGSHFSGVDN
jgi:ATP-dependent DNA helicase RecG